MAEVRVWIHAVWGTKNRNPYLTKEIRPLVVKHIRENARLKSIYIERLGGYLDHLHCLFGLNADMSVARAIQLLKGESAHWINKAQLCVARFEWADEYYAVSVGEQDLGRVRAYIDGQEEHHTRQSYAEEVSKVLEMFSSHGHG